MKDRFKVIVAVAIGLALGLGIIFAERRPPGGQTVASGKIDSPAADSNVIEKSAPLGAPQRFAVAQPKMPQIAPADRLDMNQPAVDAPRQRAAKSKAGQQKASQQNGGQALAVSPAVDSNLAAPDARVALSFVGTDPQAQVVWMNAINDPSVPADERKDLIEDLNEDGFPDPHHITQDDIPLVLNRINLLEQIGPYAMDDTNAAAFSEAYKDLTNMLSDPNPK